MAIQEHPHIGTVLFCDFGHGFIEPEMVKRLPVIVISPRRQISPLSSLRTPFKKAGFCHFWNYFATNQPTPFASRKAPAAWHEFDVRCEFSLI